VPDLASAIDRAREAGFSPVGVDLGNDEWKEAFLHPRQATGIVVQMAQAAHAWESPPPEGFPTARREPAAALMRVTHAVADLDVGLALFEGLLGGRRVGSGVAPDGTWAFVDLEWPGPPGFRLIAPGPPREARPGAPSATPLATWLGDLSGRLHHLVFARRADGRDAAPGATQPGVPGLLPSEGVARVIEPGDNLGTRLVVLGATPDPPRDQA
jgi:hypothetical protein